MSGLVYRHEQKCRRYPSFLNVNNPRRSKTSSHFFPFQSSAFRNIKDDLEDDDINNSFKQDKYTNKILNTVVHN